MRNKIEKSWGCEILLDIFIITHVFFISKLLRYSSSSRLLVLLDMFIIIFNVTKNARR